MLMWRRVYLEFRDMRSCFVVQFILFVDEFRSESRLNPSDVRQHFESALCDFQVLAYGLKLTFYEFVKEVTFFGSIPWFLGRFDEIWCISLFLARVPVKTWCTTWELLCRVRGTRFQWNCTVYRAERLELAAARPDSLLEPVFGHFCSPSSSNRFSKRFPVSAFWKTHGLVQEI